MGGGILWGQWSTPAPILNLRYPLGLINLILSLGLWDLHLLDWESLESRHCTIAFNLWQVRAHPAQDEPLP